MKLYKIHVSEKATPTIVNIQYKEESIQVFEELHYEDKQYRMNEYSRSDQGKLLRIGVYAPNAHQVNIHADRQTTQLVQSTLKPGYWYEPTKSWRENGYEEKKEAIFGGNACGTWHVSALDEKGDILEEESVIIIPSTMTYDQYKTMQAEVKSLFENLAVGPGVGGLLKETQLSLFNVEELLSILKEMKEWLQKICEAPSEQLIRTRAKVKRDRITKWDAQSIVESAVFPFRDQLSVPVIVKETNLDEHRMIRFMLEGIKDRVIHEMTVEQSAFNHLRKEKNKRRETSLFVSGDMRNHLENRISAVQKDIDCLMARRKQWEQCCAYVEGMLDESLFDVEPLSPEMTHLFSHDLSYGAVYDLNEQFEALNPQLVPTEQDFVESMMNSPHLYEVWTLLQLVHHISKLKFDCSNVCKSLVDYYARNKKISDWRFKFVNSERGEFFLYYEPDLYMDNKKLKPDYLLLYRRNGEDTWQGHTLDAKYKPYTRLSTNKIRKDIDRSCVRYLTKIKQNTIVMRSSSLVHVDEQANNWNVNQDATYSISHFSLLPGDTENISTYLKRIFHFFGGKKDLCINCGGIADVEDKGYKQTYICPHDKEVWVSNICRYKSSHSWSSRHLALMKYASGNYNTQVNNRWDVHCPVCDKDYEGNALKLNVFGHHL